VLVGYRGVIVHDRLALCWTLKKDRHGVCAAHLLRNLASVAAVATQTAWAAGLAALLVEVNVACDAARAAGHRCLAPTRQRAFRSRYEALVAEGLAKPHPEPGYKRSTLQRQSFDLVTAFDTTRQSVLRFMSTSMSGRRTTGRERPPPGEAPPEVPSCFRGQGGATRFANVRSYLSTTRKNDGGALDALTRLFNGDPWMPPQAA